MRKGVTGTARFLRYEVREIVEEGEVDHERSRLLYIDRLVGGGKLVALLEGEGRQGEGGRVGVRAGSRRQRAGTVHGSGFHRATGACAKRTAAGTNCRGGTVLGDLPDCLCDLCEHCLCVFVQVLRVGPFLLFEGCAGI